jgi:ABC-type glycerol-3-phosphate transport system substrate-binding protein
MGPQEMAGRVRLGSILILLLLLSLGCSELASLGPGTPVPPASPVPSPSPATSPSPLPPTSVAAATHMTLTVWTSAEFAPADETPALRPVELESIQGKVHAVIERKGAQGKGGLVNLLSAAASVAPSVVPDIAIVSATEAQTLAQQGLIQAWQQHLPPNLAEDLFPLAQPLGYYEEQRFGVPLALDVQHLAYDPTEVRTPPQMWRDVLTGQALYLFPAMGTGEALDALLIQYLEAGGRLTDEEGLPLLEEEPLATALARYQGAEIARVIPPEALVLDSLAACWPLYLTGQVGIVNVWASLYLRQHPGEGLVSFSPMPVGGGEEAITLGRGWLVVLVTEDPMRQEGAARLLTWWSTPQHNAALCEALSWLPPSRTAFSQWRGDVPYYLFLQTQIEGALPQPTLSPTWAEALSAAVQQVLRRKQTAQEAAAQVMAVVSRR